MVASKLLRPALALFVSLCVLALVRTAVLATPSQPLAGRNYKLSGDIPAYADVLGDQTGYSFRSPVEISADGKYAVFWADFSTDEALELYSVPLDGSEEPTRISGLHTTSTFGEFKILPDSSRVVYWIQHGVNGPVELNSVPIGGGQVTPLSTAYSSPASAQGMQDRFALSADSAHVIYLAEAGPGDIVSLYSVPSAGGPEVRLSPIITTADVLVFLITPDGSRVVYTMDTPRGSLYSAPSGGGANVTLVSNPLPGRWLYDKYTFELSADSSHVFYIIQSIIPLGKTLYRKPVGGGAAEVVHADLDDNSTDSVRFVVSPNDQFAAVAVTNYEVQPYETDVYGVPVSGGPETPLHSIPLSSLFNMRFSPQSDRFVYQARPYGESDNNLYSVPVSGGAPDTLNENGVEPVDYRFALGGSRVVYTANFSPTELYSVPLMGGQAAPLNAPMPSGGPGIETMQVTPDGKQVVYAATQQSKSIYELYVVPAAGGELTKVNRPLAQDGDVLPYGWAISPDGKTIIYVADQETSDKYELFATAFAREVYLPYIDR